MALKALQALMGNYSRAHVLMVPLPISSALSRRSTQSLVRQAQYLRHDRIHGEPG